LLFAFPIRAIREGMKFVRGAAYDTQRAIAARTETWSP
jgi:hypothetical protein